MHIGIIIGVSNYQRASSLPGCITDAKAIKQLVDMSKKCNDLLYIVENTDSKNVKSKILVFPQFCGHIRKGS